MTGGEQGVIYVATGAAHVEAARKSAASVRLGNPDLPVGLFSDMDVPSDEFDFLTRIEAPHAFSKVEWMHRSPFRQTLYLDTDTRVFGRLDDVFRLAERFELAAAQVPRYWARGYQRPWRQDLPASFPQLNTGVILYRDTPAVKELLQAWGAAYEDAGRINDQVTFRELLWLSDVRFTVLPAHYNARRYSWGDRLFSGRPPPLILHSNVFHPSKAGGPIARRLRALAVPPIGR